jgi:hypothetical protein
MRGLVACFGLALALAGGAMAQEPKGQATPASVGQGFLDGLVNGCVESLTRDVPIEQIEDAAKRFVRVVDPNQRAFALQMTRAPDSAPIWWPEKGQGIVTIVEAAGKCRVESYGAPVPETLEAGIRDLEQRGFVTVDRYEERRSLRMVALEGEASGRKLTIRISATAPGDPGMMSRFTTQGAEVEVEATSPTPSAQ